MTAAATRPDERLVQAALDRVRPRIHAHHGDVVIREITDEGVVHVGFVGNCIGCPFQLTTFGAALLPALRAVDGVTDVGLEGRCVPPPVLRRIERLSAPV